MKDLLEFSFDRCKCNFPSLYYIPGCLNSNYVLAERNADGFVNSVILTSKFPQLFVFHYL